MFNQKRKNQKSNDLTIVAKPYLDQKVTKKLTSPLGAKHKKMKTQPDQRTFCGLTYCLVSENSNRTALAELKKKRKDPSRKHRIIKKSSKFALYEYED